MEKKESKKKVAVKKVVKPLVFSNSTKLVSFKASKKFGKMNKDEVCEVSENVAEILEFKGLGKKIV